MLILVCFQTMRVFRFESLAKLFIARTNPARYRATNVPLEWKLGIC